MSIASSPRSKTTRNAPIAPAPEAQSLSERAEHEIRHRLLIGAYAPGQKLSLAEIALQLGMSVTPVREAVFKLVGVRALAFRPGYYVSVPAMTRARFLETAEIRKALESQAAQAATPLLTDADHTELARLFAAFKQAKESGLVRQALELNMNLRFFVYEKAQMPILLQLIEDMWLRTGPLFNFLFPMLPGTHQYERPYAALLKALRQRDPDKVRDAVHAAIDSGSERILPYIELSVPDSAAAGR
jgi:GntR family colanic acid and biofilm gene transcriptional regulator